MKTHFEEFAAYNAWANRRLYDAAAAVSDADRRSDQGAFFGSLFNTLSHILVADVLWMARFRQVAPPGWALTHTPHDSFEDLRAAREAQDVDIIAYTSALTEAEIEADIHYTTVTGPKDVTQKRGPALAHFFNHQTHHRGQCHMILTRLTGDAPPLDLLFYQRGA